MLKTEDPFATLNCRQVGALVGSIGRFAHGFTSS